MAVITLSELQKLGYDDLAVGVAESIVTANPIFSVLPFNTTVGNAYAFNRENAAATVISQTRGGATTNAKGAPTFVKKSLPLTSILGDAEISGLDVAQGIGTGAGNDPVAIQVAAKAKSIGREFQRQMILGNSTSPASNVTSVTNGEEFDGLDTILADSAFSGQVLDKADAALTLDMIDELMYKVTAGDCQWIMANGAGVRKILSLMRGSGGVTMTELAGVQVPSWNGVPIFRNDFIPLDIDGTTAGNQTNIYAGMFDDGSRHYGIAGVIPQTGGITVDDLGASHSADIFVHRVKMYCSFAVHSPLSVAQLKSVTV